jgi:hypothetical protein
LDHIAQEEHVGCSAEVSVAEASELRVPLARPNEHDEYDGGGLCRFCNVL